MWVFLNLENVATLKKAEYFKNYLSDNIRVESINLAVLPNCFILSTGFEIEG